MGWTSVNIAGHTADALDIERPAGVVLFLHGYDSATLRDNPHWTGELKAHRLACVCPHAPRSWWLDEVYAPFDPTATPLAFLRGPVTEFVQQRWSLQPPQIAVAGVEMGGQGALQLAYRTARKFPIVAAVSPKVDFESWHGHGTSLDELFPDREAARQRIATLHIHPLDWPRHQLLVCDPADEYCIDGVLTLASKLSSSGIPFDSDFTSSHGGYGWKYANAMAPRVIQFLGNGLADVAARLP